jgi:hypothetical protein
MNAPRVEVTDNGFSVLKEIIDKAEKRIHLTSYLFYDENVADLLIDKKNKGLTVEVLTTPSAAARSDELKHKATNLQKKLQSAKIDIMACDWEVGKPERTTSTFAGGRTPTWFAMHAKYMVTDKHALVMSADLTEDFSKDRKWDSFVIYEDQERIQTFLKKHEELKQFLCNVESHVPEEYIDQRIQKPRRLLKGYPPKQIEANIEGGVYVLPIDTYGRNVIEKVVEDSEEFIYCMYETFYDDKLNFDILKKLITDGGIDLKILSPPVSVYQQNPLKARANFVQLVAYGAEVKNIEGLRGKLMITDKAVVSGSFDISVMGLGRLRTEKKLKFWVESIEIMDLNTDESFISLAKSSFLKLYEKATKQYGKWFKKDAELSLRAAGAAKVALKAKDALGLLIFEQGRQSISRTKKISQMAVEIARLSNEAEPYVKIDDVVNAQRLLVLKERDQLKVENVTKILGTMDGKRLIKRLNSIARPVLSRR